MEVARPIFQEKLTPSLGFLLALALALPMVGLALAPFGIELAVIAATLVTSGLIASAILLAPVLTVDADEFRAGKIRVPRLALGVASEIHPSEAFAERGPRLNPGAQLLLRGDIQGLVKIEVKDPNDPTPYLLISTRRPAELVKALS